MSQLGDKILVKIKAKSISHRPCNRQVTPTSEKGFIAQSFIAWSFAWSVQASDIFWDCSNNVSCEFFDQFRVDTCVGHLCKLRNPSAVRFQ